MTGVSQPCAPPGSWPGRADTRHQLGRATWYLHPGHCFASSKPHAVSTVLGSCVAVCLFDPAAGVGGMNHFLLPRGAHSGRFASGALPLLLGEVLRLGARQTSLRAAVFGGSCVLVAFRQPNHLGQQNVAAALEFLAAEGVPVVEQHTGGEAGRKVRFETDTGLAVVNLLGTPAAAAQL